MINGDLGHIGEKAVNPSAFLFGDADIHRSFL